MSGINGRMMKVGDAVYDVIKGMGTVISDGDGILNVVVRFSDNDEMNFAQDGTFQGVRRLYWKPAYIIEPRGPQDVAYEQAMELAEVIYEKLKLNEERNR